MLKLFKYLKKYWLQIAGLVILIFATVAANLQLPDYMAKIVNEGIIGSDNGLIWHYGIYMLLIALGGAVATIGVGFLAAKIATGFFQRHPRKSIFPS